MILYAQYHTVSYTGAVQYTVMQYDIYILNEIWVLYILNEIWVFTLILIL